MFGSENLILTSPLVFLICVAVSALLTILENKTRKKWLFAILGAVSVAASFVVFLVLGAVLSDLLLYLLIVVCMRLVPMMAEGRGEA